jgi:hypothetical protein
MLDWLQTNKEWVFSGVGVAVLGAVVAFARWLRRRPPSPVEDLARAQLQERGRVSRPFFRWRNGNTDYTTLTYEFQNEGGAVSDLAVETNADVDASITPQEMLQSQGMGFVRFRSRAGRLPFPIRFQIHYTRIDVTESKAYSLSAADRPPQDIR